MNLNAQAKAALCFSAILALSLCPTARTDTIESGSDYSATQEGTQFTFGSYGTISLMGVPIGPGLTDTIVQRLSDEAVSPGGVAAPIPIQIVALSLESTTPVNIAGSFFDIFATLDPTQLTNDTGQMTITENSAGTGGTLVRSSMCTSTCACNPAPGASVVRAGLHQ